MALFEVNCFSTALSECVHFNVIIPQKKVDGEIGIKSKGAEKYPVLYLLHGLSDDETIWLRRTSIERYATEKGLAVVMPSTRRGWYIDSDIGKFYTFIGTELPALIAEFFPSISSDRDKCFVAGLSMGGYGALKFALSMPEKFGAVAALSGALDIASPRTYGWMYNDHILKSDPTGTENDVYELVRKFSYSEKPPVYIWCGTEDELLKDNRDMRDLLVEYGFELNYNESTGNHSWKYWDEQIEKVINWLPL